MSQWRVHPPTEYCGCSCTRCAAPIVHTPLIWDKTGKCAAQLRLPFHVSLFHSSASAVFQIRHGWRGWSGSQVCRDRLEAAAAATGEPLQRRRRQKQQQRQQQQRGVSLCILWGWSSPPPPSNSFAHFNEYHIHATLVFIVCHCAMPEIRYSLRVSSYLHFL